MRFLFNINKVFYVDDIVQVNPHEDLAQNNLQYLNILTKVILKPEI